MKQAVDGLGAVEFFFESYIPKFVKFLSETYVGWVFLDLRVIRCHLNLRFSSALFFLFDSRPLVVEETICSTLLAQGRPYLLMLLAHPSDGVRKVTYAQILDVLSVGFHFFSTQPTVWVTKFQMFCLDLTLLISPSFALWLAMSLLEH